MEINRNVLTPDEIKYFKKLFIEFTNKNLTFSEAENKLVNSLIFFDSETTVGDFYNVIKHTI